MSYPDLLDVETEASAIESLVGVSTTNVTLTGLGEPIVTPLTRLTKGLMETFRVAPALGRDVRAVEFGADAPSIVVIGHGFWQTRLGGQREVLGEALSINGTDYEIVGVAPPGFDYPEGADLWVPRRMDPEDCARGCHTMRGVGRLASMHCRITQRPHGRQHFPDRARPSVGHHERER